MDAIRTAMDSVVHSMACSMSNIDFAGLKDVLSEDVAQILEYQRKIIESGALPVALEEASEQLRTDLSLSIFSITEDVLPYTTPPQRDAMREISPDICIPNTSQSPPKSKLTFEQILALISLIISILGFIQQQSPDPQLTAIAEKIDTLTFQIQDASDRLDAINQRFVHGNHVGDQPLDGFDTSAELDDRDPIDNSTDAED